MANLPTDYADDVLDVSKNTNRKYNMIENQDGTVSFEDVTQYQQEGTQYGAGDVNAQNREINALNSRLTLFSFRVDPDTEKPQYSIDGGQTWENFSSGVEYLGTARSYDLSSRPDYQSLTADNFICVCRSGSVMSHWQGVGSASAWTTGYGVFNQATKSYDSNTGILTIGGGTIYSSTQINMGKGENSASLTVDTYLVSEIE